MADKKYIDKDYLKLFWEQIKGIPNETFYNDLKTTDKTLVGAINELVPPIASQEYPAYTIAGNDTNNGWVYFFKVNITDTANWKQPWQVKYRVFVDTTHANTKGWYECNVGAAGSTALYYNYNNFYSNDYRPIYAHALIKPLEGKSAQGAYIGVRINGAYNSTTLARVIKVELIECIGCIVEVQDSLLVHKNIFNNTVYSASELAGTYGLQEVGDNDTTTVVNFGASSIKLAAESPILSYFSLIGFNRAGEGIAISNRTGSDTTDNSGISTTRRYATIGFDWSKPLCYPCKWSATQPGAYINDSVRQIMGGVDFRKTDNCVAASTANSLGIVQGKMVYFKGVIKSDGLFYLAPFNVTYNSTTYKKVWTQDIPTQAEFDADGNQYVYWLVGHPYYNSNNAASLYQINLYADNKMYWYHNGRFEEYGVGGQSDFTLDIPKADNNTKGIYYVKEDDTVANLTMVDTEYIINYDLDLNEGTWNVPAGSIITFNGGSIKNGTLNGSVTQINSVTEGGLQCTITGTWDVKSWRPEWFKVQDATIDTPNDYYWNNAMQKCMDVAGATQIPMELVAPVYTLYNYERTAPNNNEPDCYDSLLNLSNNLTIFSNNKSKVDVLGVSQHRGTYYTAVFGHRYEGTSAYGSKRNTSWNNIKFKGIVIDNTHDTLVEEPAKDYPNGSGIVNKYCIYMYNACNVTIEDCDLYCGGSNAIFFDVAYKRGTMTQIVGHADNCRIHNCYIFMKTKEQRMDLSALFIAVDNTDISNCIIEHNWEDDPNDKWGCGGIELHAGNFHIHDCSIIGFENGLNACGYLGDKHGYQLIENNKFDRCNAVLALWGIGEEKFCECNGVRFIGNTCTKCKQPVRQNQNTKPITDILVKNNVFDCIPTAGGAISFAHIDLGLEMDIIDNTFKNCAASPFFEFQSGTTTVNSTIKVVGNTFLNAFGPVTTTPNSFYYWVPNNANSVLYVANNTYDIPDEVNQPPIITKHDGIIVRDQHFSHNISILEYYWWKNNPAKTKLPDYIDSSDFHPAGSIWLDGDILYRQVSKAAGDAEDFAGTSNPISTEPSNITYIADGTKYWHATNVEHPEYFRVGDTIEIMENGGVRYRSNIAAICGDDIYFCGNADGQKSWTGTLTMKVVDYKTRGTKKVDVFSSGLDANKPTNIQAGCTYFATDTRKYYLYDGTAWTTLSTSTTTVVDNLTSDSATSALSAKQGKALKTLIDAIPSYNAGTDISFTEHTGGGLDINAKNTVRMLGLISDYNTIDVSAIEKTATNNGSVFATFMTGATVSNHPFIGQIGGIFATGYVFKTDDEWCTVTWRMTSKASGIYTRFKNPGQAWGDWYRADNGVSNLGALSSYNIDLASVDTNSAVFSVQSTNDGTGPWASGSGEVFGTFNKIGGYWYQTVWRIGTANSGQYVRKMNPDKLKLNPPENPWGDWIRVDQDITGKEDSSNKVTTWSTTTTNTNYPSEKLVKDSLNSLEFDLKRKKNRPSGIIDTSAIEMHYLYIGDTSTNINPFVSPHIGEWVPVTRSFSVHNGQINIAGRIILDYYNAGVTMPSNFPSLEFYFRYSCGEKSMVSLYLTDFFFDNKGDANNTFNPSEDLMLVRIDRGPETSYYNFERYEYVLLIKYKWQYTRYQVLEDYRQIEGDDDIDNYKRMTMWCSNVPKTLTSAQKANTWKKTVNLDSADYTTRTFSWWSNYMSRPDFRECFVNETINLSYFENTYGSDKVIQIPCAWTDETFTPTDKIKLSGVEFGAEVNQNAFSNVKVGTTTIEADAKTDVLEFVAGTNITLTPDATNDKITISAAGTDVSGKEDKSNKITEWCETPDNNHYPTEKLVKDSLTSLQNQITALVLGAKLSLSVTPTVGPKGKAQDYKWTATFTGATPNSIKIFDNTKTQVASGTSVTSINTGNVSKTFNADTTYTAEAEYMGMTFNASVKVTVKDLILYGFTGQSATAHPTTTYGKAVTTSIGTRYTVTCGANNQVFKIYVPNGVTLPNSFSMGGSPASYSKGGTVVVNGITYTPYTSDAIYDTGASLDIVIS